MKSKEMKIEEAEERQLYYDALSPKQKLSKLDKRLGKNIGAKKEREKIKKQIKRTPIKKEKKNGKTLG